MNPYQIINSESIQENMMNNMEIIKQMIPMFLGQGVEDFNALEAAIETQNHDEIKSKAHHIKPTMQYLGATDLRLKFQKLEDDAAKNTPMQDLSLQFQAIKKDFELAMDELRDYQIKLS
ncbi:Hpt domain-containing protein [Sphingobacterium endophyticum]|uniref:Hpt domain-containing protein n=1 Tax=Sphingobacterium endophyticum TaxID=2546448 RepID=UPI0012E11DE4|nr:Hpt domain-containing protein [Sphingobacterium endophyticum]